MSYPMVDAPFRPIVATEANTSDMAEELAVLQSNRPEKYWMVSAPDSGVTYRLPLGYATFERQASGTVLIRGILRTQNKALGNHLIDVIDLAVRLYPEATLELECFNVGSLVWRYTSLGFRVTGVAPFLAQYRPAGWHPSFGTPSVFSMVRNAE